MFSSVTEKFRSYIFPSNIGDNVDTSSRKRKRQFEEPESDDSDVEIVSIKRPRQSVTSTSVFNFFSTPVNKMTDWFRRHRSNFSTDFTFKSTNRQPSSSNRPPDKILQHSKVPTTNGKTQTTERRTTSKSKQKSSTVQTKRSYRDVLASSCINPIQTNGFSNNENIFNYTKKPAHQERSSLFTNTNGNTVITSQPTAQLCVRLDEKEKYRQLIQQFTTVPIETQTTRTKTPPKPSIFNRSSSASFNTSKNWSFINGSSQPSSSTPLNESRSKRYKPQVKPIFSDPLNISSSYLATHHKSAVDLLASAPSLPILQTSTNIHIADDTFTQEDTNVKERITSPHRKSFSESSSKTVEELEESLYLKDNWLKEFKFSSALNKEERLRKISEAEVVAKVHHEYRIKKDVDLEKSLNERMKALEPFTSTIEIEDEEDESIEILPELTHEMRGIIERAFKSGPAMQVLSEGYKLQILRQDMLTLKDLNWLNDEVINFYMNMLMERGEQDNMATVHAFNTFFYPKLMSAGHSAVRRWTRKVDVLAVDYIIVPVHLGMHWCLAIMDFRKKCIRYFDSMGGNNNKCLNALRQYLCDESLDKKKQEFDLSGWTTVTVKNVPQQMNGSDCGMFACKYAEYITRGAEITFSQEDMPYFRKRMVYEIMTKQLLQ